MQVHFDFLVDIVALIGLLLLPALAGLVFWIIESIGMYTIAKRRGVHHAWLSWIPIGNMWMLGSISDQYRYVARGERRSRRKVLLVVSILYAVLFCILIFCFVSFLVQMAGYSGMPESEMFRLVVAPMVRIMGLSVLMLVCAVVRLVFGYIALSDLFRSCNPGNYVLFLVLSILISATRPFFVFACRKQDGGMPPRREIPRQPGEPETQWRPAEPEAPTEPWERNGEP